MDAWPAWPHEEFLSNYESLMSCYNKILCRTDHMSLAPFLRLTKIAGRNTDVKVLYRPLEIMKRLFMKNDSPSVMYHSVAEAAKKRH